MKHFQAVSMLARSLFELAVDLELINVIPNAVQKTTQFIEHEKLRAAKKFVKYEDSNGLIRYYSGTNRRAFIATKEASINAVSSTLWSVNERKNLSHWSGLDLSRRVDKLSPLYKEIYHCLQPQLSWSVHAGLTGVMNLEPETFAYMCSAAYEMSNTVFEQLMTIVIKEFQLATVDQSLFKKMEFAKFVAVLENHTQVKVLRREMGLSL